MCACVMLSHIVMVETPQPGVMRPFLSPVKISALIGLWLLDSSRALLKYTLAAGDSFDHQLG
jgi:hypothetical protein